jgi:hypothetical protein
MTTVSVVGRSFSLQLSEQLVPFATELASSLSSLARRRRWVTSFLTRFQSPYYYVWFLIRFSGTGSNWSLQIQREKFSLPSRAVSALISWGLFVLAAVFPAALLQISHWCSSY